MKTILISFFLLTGSILMAQTESDYQSVKIEDVVYSMNLKAAKSSLFDFIEKNNIEVVSQEDNKFSLKIEFMIPEKLYPIYDSPNKTLGYSDSKEMNTISNLNEIKALNLELNFLKNKKESYSEMLKKLDEKSENYILIWNELKETENEIFNNELKLLKLTNKSGVYEINLQLKAETTSPEYTKVSFVNMPGFEYSYLDIESPKIGISATEYQGYFLKYLFTRGKSYATIGVYKNTEISKTDFTAFSEMFILGFGQDFYSRYLGRGSKKFLNLYSGYQIGGIMASGVNTKKNMFFISPSIGLELFKNKYFLIDSKVNYFVPLGNYRNLRGLSYNLSFNFVF